ncbi:thiamine-phosphate pyrophosphorylase [Methylopila capsulata]|uniref:Thiamine-phosphate synthase n=1 Tax=Methylopila capsulata TaxID=61654 RepID=A0A9W6IVZ1_9HYPH|nr:thiamine phosphate synthase [Methylopila capsulata]MBM7853169.1 thiamine-phosphate pyrophosphorylase [Methylopila capsulata]GLK57617.1 thiamine-phosphate synthase [Methylopila capsulata]
MTRRLDPFYPVVDSAAWVRRMTNAGAKLVQLRVKDKPESILRAEISDALATCSAVGADLVVNDYWEIAIDLGASFLHLGQEDLDDADLTAIRAAGIRLGVSTHTPEELDRALSVDPHHIALGPIWPTILKKMPFAPQGLERIGEWKRAVGERPLVAIGGLTPDRAAQCLAAGADVVAVVNDVVGAADPEARAREWIELTRAAA